ncbi:STAS domain-containing protein [Conexibacter sp. SYSU D00693]|uniref:STAS domain-containing protein n=1 Tax=Conexibacter sp. SYSU D00693 TaxID=2812560 RepID=UPI00196A5C33|nr:STAS domain-containing protein [Conexibacter sp. SYSU D00693]
MDTLRPEPFRVQRRDDGARMVLHVAGPLDLAAEEPLRRALTEALDGGDHPVLVDLEGCTFIDSRGMSVLLDGHRKADGRLVLRGAHGQVAAALELVDVRRHLPFED